MSLTSFSPHALLYLSWRNEFAGPFSFYGEWATKYQGVEVNLCGSCRLASLESTRWRQAGSPFLQVHSLSGPTCTPALMALFSREQAR